MSQLPHPDQFSDWREWALAFMAQAQREFETPNVVVQETPPTDPPSEFENITIRDSLDRIILNPDGLWIWDPTGALPIAPNIFEIDTRHLVDAAISTAKLADFAVNTDKLANLAVNAAKLFDGSVGETKLADQAVVNSKLADFSVDAFKIADSAITALKLADDSVSTEKILAGAVTTDRIAIAAIVSNRIANDAVVRDKIADFAVDAARLADAAVNRFKIGDGEVVTEKIADLAVETVKIGLGAVNTLQVSDLAVTNLKLGLGSVDRLNIRDAAVGSAAIAELAVGTLQLANGAVLNAKIGDAEISTGKIADLAVNELKVANGAISSLKIQDLAVTNAKIDNGAIDRLKIGAAVIDRTHIQDGEIVNAKIGDVIQSVSWNDATKTGWRINKNGQIEGQGITIYDENGDIIFGAAGIGAIGGANLLNNSGFEEEGAGWALYSNDNATNPVTVSYPAGRLFGKAWRGEWGQATTLIKGVRTSSAPNFTNLNVLQPFTEYVLSFYGRAVQSGGSPIFSITWNFPPTETTWLVRPAPTSAWQRYVVRFITSATPDSTIYLGLQNPGGFGWAEIDDVQLEEGRNVTQWRESLADAGRRALWPFVQGTGRPADFADVTALNTAAAIAGQGALATQSSVDLANQVFGALGVGSVSGLGDLAVQDLINLATQATGSLPNSQVAGLGALATQNAVNLATQVVAQLAAANVSGLGDLALQDLVNLATQTTGSLPNTSISGLGPLAVQSVIDLATQASGLLANAQVAGLGSLALQNVVNLLTQVTGQLPSASVSGLGALALQDLLDLNAQVTNQLANNRVSGLGALALQNLVDLATQVQGSLSNSQVAGLGALALLNIIDLATQSSGDLPNNRVSGLGALATQSTVDLTTQVIGLLANSQISGLGALALLSQLTGANISTYIEAGAINTALIADAAILRAKIGDAQINSAKIEDGAITSLKVQDGAILSAAIADAQIVNAKIADGTILSAKIANLVVDKLLGGNLDAVIEVAGGRLQFTVGAARMVLGNGFGSSNQFLLWFGPNVALGAMTEANATVYIKTDGSAYFGGTLSAGVFKNAVRTSSLSATAEIDTGDFGSNGGARVVTVSYEYVYQIEITNAYSVTGGTSVTVILERWNGASWVLATSQAITGSVSGESGAGPSEPGFVRIEMGGSFTFTDNTGGTTARFRARLSSRVLTTINSATQGVPENTQILGIVSVEE